MKTIDNQEYEIDKVTGYLEQTDKTAFNPKQKTLFLKRFKQSGDKTDAIESLGFTIKDLLFAIKHDVKFKEDLDYTMLAMKHRLEGLMYTSGLSERGHNARLQWLQLHFPGDYGKKHTKIPETPKNPVQTLLDGLNDNP